MPYFQDGLGLDKKSIKILSDLPTSGLLFANLHTIYCTYSKKSLPLLHLPLPSLVRLDVQVNNPRLFLDSFASFPDFFPNVRELVISVYGDTRFIKIGSSCFSFWRNLHEVCCPYVALDENAITHLSRMPALTRLDCALTRSVTFPASNSPLSLTTLRKVFLNSYFLDPISLLLSQTRLPAVEEFSVYVHNCPSRQELSSFLAGVQTSTAGDTIEELDLSQLCHLLGNFRSEAPLLGLKDLRPCMEFSHLRDITLDIKWDVGLTDGEVLELASAWPKLECLSINSDWGWNSRGGITPGGLVQLLQTCQSLVDLALCLDTQGYTEFPESPASLGLPLSPTFSSLDVLDSIIEAESVPAIATFISGIATYTAGYFSFSAWECRGTIEHPNMEEYRELWGDIKDRVYGSLGQPLEHW